MKTRLLKRLRREAKRQVRAISNDCEMQIVWRKQYYYRGNDMENDDFYFCNGTVFYNIEDLKLGLVEARRIVILQMADEYRNNILKKKIKNL